MPTANSSNPKLKREKFPEDERNSQGDSSQSTAALNRAFDELAAEQAEGGASEGGETPDPASKTGSKAGSAAQAPELEGVLPENSRSLLPYLSCLKITVR
jgi:hypothetical protein